MGHAPNLELRHRYVPAEDDAAPLLLLLPRAGQDETALLALGQRLHPGAPALGVLHGLCAMPAGAASRAVRKAARDELLSFHCAAARAYDLMLVPTIAVGDAEGADLAASLAMRVPQVFAAVLLLRPSLSVLAPSAPLHRLPVAIAVGEHDAVAPPDCGARLARSFLRVGAEVTFRGFPTGHGLCPLDAAFGREWLRAVFPPCTEPPQ